MTPNAAARHPFAAGLALGALAGGAAVLLLHPAGGGPPARGPGEEARRIRGLEARAAEADALEERAAGLRRRLEALEARAPGPPAPVPAPSAGGGDGTAPAPAVDPDAGPPSPLHGELAAGLEGEPGTETHRAAVQGLAAHLAASGGPPAVEEEMAWAGRLLAREALRERITEEEAEGVAALLFGLPPGHPSRPFLARTVAGAWGFGERLGPFLSRFDAGSEPAVHRAILGLLDDEHPGAAFGEYVLRLIAGADDPEILKAVLRLDILEASATATTAAPITRAIEARLREGRWDPDLRSRAGMAIAVACLRDPGTGVEALRRLAAEESDPVIAGLYGRAADALERGDATLKSLERLFG